MPRSTCDVYAPALLRPIMSRTPLQRLPSLSASAQPHTQRWYLKRGLNGSPCGRQDARADSNVTPNSLYRLLALSRVTRSAPVLLKKNSACASVGAASVAARARRTARVARRMAYLLQK